MAVVIRQFQLIAEAIAAHMAEVLQTQVWVLDEHGVVAASSERDAIGCAFDELASTLQEDEILRAPLRDEAEGGEVVVAEPHDGERISPRLAHALIDLMIQQTRVVSQFPDRYELKNKFIHDLLRGQIADEDAAIREGQMLGMDLTVPRAVILIDAADYILSGGEYIPDYLPIETSEAHMPRRAQHVIASVVGFFSLPSDTICAYIGDGEVAVLKASGTQDLVAWTDGLDMLETISASWANLTALKRAAGALLTRLRHDTQASINIGIGRYHPGIRKLAGSYQDARAALSLGRRFHGQNQVHCLDKLGIAAFVGVPDEETKVGLAHHLLSPLDQDNELIETLDAFFQEDCSPSTTANHLCIHRNTLSYRLDKITSLTGLDPRRFDDAVQIRLALVLRALRTQAA